MIALGDAVRGNSSLAKSHKVLRFASQSGFVVLSPVKEAHHLRAGRMPTTAWRAWARHTGAQRAALCDDDKEFEASIDFRSRWRCMPEGAVNQSSVCVTPSVFIRRMVLEYAATVFLTLVAST